MADVGRPVGDMVERGVRPRKYRFYDEEGKRFMVFQGRHGERNAVYKHKDSENCFTKDNNNAWVPWVASESGTGDVSGGTYVAGRRGGNHVGQDGEQ